MTDTPTTTGRRVWGLTWRLALPWALCGGLLWALAWLTPDPPTVIPSSKVIYNVDATHPDRKHGFALIRPKDDPHKRFGSWMPGHPWAVFLCWNGAGYLRFYESPEIILPAPQGSETLGVLWLFDGEADDRFFIGTMSLWLLIPFPLLWSGFNLWRWVRRGGER